eukprot:gene6703-1199_t
MSTAKRAKLVPGHESMVLWLEDPDVDPELERPRVGKAAKIVRVYLETFKADPSRDAAEFLTRIGEPVARTHYIHEYKLTMHSLYSAATFGLEAADIISQLARYSKMVLSQAVKEWVSKLVNQCDK